MGPPTPGPRTRTRHQTPRTKVNLTAAESKGPSKTQLKQRGPIRAAHQRRLTRRLPHWSGRGLPEENTFRSDATVNVTGPSDLPTTPAEFLQRRWGKRPHPGRNRHQHYMRAINPLQKKVLPHSGQMLLHTAGLPCRLHGHTTQSQKKKKTICEATEGTNRFCGIRLCTASPGYSLKRIRGALAARPARHGKHPGAGDRRWTRQGPLPRNPGHGGPVR